MTVATRKRTKKAAKKTKKRGAKKKAAKKRGAKKAAEENKPPAPDTCIRAITLPVACPVDLDWKEAGKLLNASFAQSRNLHNWFVRQLARLDSAPIEIKNGKQKLPKLPSMPTVDKDGYSLYLFGRKQAPLLNSGTVSQILQDVYRAYKRERFDVWRGARSLRCYRTEIIPVRKQELQRSPIEEHNSQFVVGFPLADPKTGKVVWTRWRLRGGRRYGRAMGGVRAILQGHAELRTMYFLQQRNRATGESRLMCKIVARFPVRERDPESRGDLLVCTHPAGLLRYVSGGLQAPRRGKQKPCWLRYNHVRRLLAQRNRHTRHLNDDLVKERRSPRKKRKRMGEGNRVRLDKLSRALGDAIKCAAKEIVGVAVRRRVKRLVYRDTRALDDKGKRGPEDRFGPGLRWYDLRMRISTLCLEQGVEFVYDEDGTLVPEKLDLSQETVKDLVHEHLNS